MKGHEALIIDALKRATEELEDYSIMEILYSVLRVLGISGTNKLLKVSGDEFYNAIFEAIRDDRDTDFSEEELQQIEDNLKMFNNSKKWERLKQTL